MDNKLILKSIWRLSFGQLKMVFDGICERTGVSLEVAVNKSSMSRYPHINRTATW